MVSPTDTLAQLAILRQLLLERVAAGQVLALDRAFREIADEIEDRLRSRRPITEYQGKRLEAQIRQISEDLIIPAPYLAELPLIEAQAAISGLAAISVDAVLPSVTVLNAIAGTALIEGATIGTWFENLNQQMLFDIERTVRTGAMLGNTNQQIARDIVGILAEGNRGPQDLKRYRRDAEAITRTAVQTFANEARLSVFEANTDVVKAVQWVSTLDSRTTDICMARSGKVWSLPNYTPQRHTIQWKAPPAHWRCRSTIIPVTKTFRELGIDRDEIPESTRSSQYGQVSALLSFDKWLDAQPKGVADEMLGKGRAQMWRDGVITLSQLLDQRGNPLTLKELRDRYGS